MPALQRALLLFDISLKDIRVIRLKREKLHSIVSNALNTSQRSSTASRRKVVADITRSLLRRIKEKLDQHSSFAAINYKDQCIILPLIDPSDNTLQNISRIIFNLKLDNRIGDEILKALVEDLPAEEMALTEALDPFNEDDWRQLVILVKKAINKCFSQILDPLRNGIDIITSDEESFQLKIKKLRPLRILPQYHLGILIIPSLSPIGSRKSESSAIKSANEAIISRLNNILSQRCYFGYNAITPQIIRIFYDIKDALLALQSYSSTKSVTTNIENFYTIDTNSLNPIWPDSRIKRRFSNGFLSDEGNLSYLLRELGPYDKNHKQVRKIRLLFLVHEKEPLKIKETMEKLTNIFDKTVEELPERIGLGKEELEFEILNDKVVEFSLDSNSPKSIDKIPEEYGIRQFSDALRDGEADILLIGTSSHRNYPIASNADEFYYSPKKYFIEKNIQSQFLSGYGLMKKEKRGFIGILDAFNQKGWNENKILNSPEFLNLLLNIYIKATGKPWIVEQVPDSLLHIFIAIKVYRVAQGYGEGIAVILDDSGSIIDIRTIPAQYSSYRKSYYLTADDMSKIIEAVLLDLYEKEKRQKPDTIHLGIFRLSRFHKEELKGLTKAVNNLENRGLIIRIAPISILGARIYPTTQGKGRQYVTIGGNGCMILPARDVCPTIAYIDKRLSQNVILDWKVNNLVNCLEALYKTHWQTFWGSKLRFPPIIKFAESIAKFRRKGLPEPTDELLKTTPWFI